MVGSAAVQGDWDPEKRSHQSPLLLVLAEQVGAWGSETAPHFLKRAGQAGWGPQAAAADLTSLEAPLQALLKEPWRLELQSFRPWMALACH